MEKRACAVHALVRPQAERFPVEKWPVSRVIVQVLKDHAAVLSKERALSVIAAYFHQNAATRIQRKVGPLVEINCLETDCFDPGKELQEIAVAVLITPMKCD